MRHTILLTLAVFAAAFSPYSPVSATAALSAEVDPAVLKAEADRIALIQRIQPAVLAVFSGLPGHPGGGSGVVITPDGYAITNFHVVKPCGVYMKCGMADGKLYDAILVGLDPTGDVALIKLLGRDDFPVAKIGNSDKLRVGDSTYALGNPFLLASNLKPTVTHGIVSGVRRYQYPSDTILEYTDCIQTDAAVNPGNSGGPLFNAEGELVGINGRCSFEKRGRVSVGVGYAISINQIKKFLGVLHSGRIVDHARLGATVVFDEENRVVVDGVEPSSDVARRGLLQGDEIVRFAGRLIDSPNTLQNVLGIYPSGWRIPITYRCEGEDHTIYARLEDLHTDSTLIDAVAGKKPPKPGEPEKKPEGKQPDEGKPSDGKPNAKKPEAKKPEKPVDPEFEKLPPAVKKLIEDAKKQELPEHIKKVYIKKDGFANYYFNTLENRRVQDTWFKAIQHEKLIGDWTLEGLTATKHGMRLVFKPDGIMAQLGGEPIQWNGKEGMTESRLEQDETGGLFPALHLWHRLTTMGNKAFDVLDYQGQYPTPLPQKDGSVVLRDVLVGSTGGVDCWFYFDVEKGLLTEIEFFAFSGEDPCLVQLLDYKTVDENLVPTRLEIRRGDQRFSPIVIDSFKVSK